MALAESFGRGCMTNHWADIENADVVLMMGSNPAENHPISFKWVLKAKNRGATLIHVDPRYTRTSGKCDKHISLRSGTDIAILGGFIKYILDNKLYFHDYVKNYTNATYLVNKNFKFDEGLFSGFDPKTESYDRSSWSFQVDKNNVPLKDETMQDPNCVLNILHKHYSRYTLEKVSKMSSTPIEDLKYLYDTFASTGKPDKAGTIMYAMGWTQHTYGVQNIRTMSIIQLLLGNMGIAGGGINALRGEANVQGSTDQGLLANIYPGYIPTAKASYANLENYLKAVTPVSNDPMSANWLQNIPKYFNSYLKSIYPNQTAEEAYNFLPKLEDEKKLTDYYWMSIFDEMSKGNIQGLFAWGMNPTCSGPDSNATRDNLCKLDWLVNVNLYENETSSFWKGPNMKPEDISTEVFFLPCAAFNEKPGSIANSSRWMQWRYAGPQPKEGAQPDGEMFFWIGEHLQEMYEKEGGAYPEPILELDIHAWADGHLFNAEKVAKLMNGKFVKDVTIGDKTYKAGTQVPNFTVLQDDGSTACGNWIHAGSWTEEGNMMARRDSSQTAMQANINLTPNWAYAWPMNRRIVYNRASVDLQGNPYNKDKALIAWQSGRWEGYEEGGELKYGEGKWIGDIPDGAAAPGACNPFIMQKDGVGTIFGQGLVDGPLPEYYEPIESPIDKHIFSKQFNNPVTYMSENAKLAEGNTEYPYIGCTYRVTEHWQTGLMTRRMSWLVECEPQVFAEICPELAEKKNIANGDKVKISSVRGDLYGVAIVTKRLVPFEYEGKQIYMVGFPWHFGWLNPKDGGDSANLLTPTIGDPNAAIPSSKAFLVNIEKVVS